MVVLKMALMPGTRIEFILRFVTDRLLGKLRKIKCRKFKYRNGTCGMLPRRVRRMLYKQSSLPL